MSLRDTGTLTRKEVCSVVASRWKISQEYGTEDLPERPSRGGWRMENEELGLRGRVRRRRKDGCELGDTLDRKLRLVGPRD